MCFFVSWSIVVSLRIVVSLVFKYHHPLYTLCDSGFEPTFVNCIKPETCPLPVWYQCDFGSTNKKRMAMEHKIN